ncbi:MAG: hypothetical protein FJ264_15920 [Planctomycetes bacterium]|nr:hypothetical protein [Planctomycetota bacterium]
MEKKRETKLKLDDIPKIGTAGREILVRSLTELDEYKKAIDEGFSGFSEEELKTIEQKYTTGMQREDVQYELKEKKWPLNINTIKHYIKVGQLPKATCCKKEGKTMYFYPKDFMRHLNLIRFLLATGKKSDSFAAVVKVLADIEYRDDVLMDKHDDECYKEYDYGFLHVIYIGIDEIRGGVYYGEKAVKAAFGNNKEKENKYLKLLDKISHLADEISKVADIFKKESGK